MLAEATVTPFGVKELPIPLDFNDETLHCRPYGSSYNRSVGSVIESLQVTACQERLKGI